MRSSRAIHRPLLFFLLLLTAMPVTVSASSDLVLVLDASGSMWGQIEGENKIVIARNVLDGLIDGLADDRRVGLVAYGHRREGDCDDIETIVPLGALDRAALKERIAAINPKGKTPITGSVKEAFTLLEGGGGATVIVVSDGLETCAGDPCQAVRAAREQGIEFVLHVVGFDVAKEDVSSLECMSQAGGGLFLSAENAGQLGDALETAAATTPETPAGILSVKGVANGKLHDLAIQVADASSGKAAGRGRTYASPETNPREIPLPDGTYDVRVNAIGLKGDVNREFRVVIADGALVDTTFDFSTGEIALGCTRNGALSDGLYHVYVADTREVAAQGRTYGSESSNPAHVRITPGDYDVQLGAIEIESRPTVPLGRITVAPGETTTIAHDFKSGSLSVGVKRGDELVDATVNVYRDGTNVGGSRSYTAPTSNPVVFELEPGDYEVKIGVIRGEKYELQATVTAGETTERSVEVE